MWKTGEDRKKEKELTRKKEKEHTRKKRDGIRTTELNRRDQVTAAKSWPSSLRKEGNRGRLSGSSTYWIGNTHHAPSENRSTKSADGRMATEAAWLECKESTGRKEKTERANRKRKTHLTHTGLLMEGALWCYMHSFMVIRKVSVPASTFR